jgi:hypothetical protein
VKELHSETYLPIAQTKTRVYVQLTLHLAATYFCWLSTHDTVSATSQLVNSIMGHLTVCGIDFPFGVDSK